MKIENLLTRLNTPQEEPVVVEEEMEEQLQEAEEVEEEVVEEEPIEEYVEDEEDEILSFWNGLLKYGIKNIAFAILVIGVVVVGFFILDNMGSSNRTSDDINGMGIFQMK